MTIIVGFVNSSFAILGIDGMVMQTRVYDDGSLEKERILRSKIGEIGDVYVAHQGRISAKDSKDYSTQDICDLIELQKGEDFQNLSKSIVIQLTKFLDMKQNNILVIAGLDQGKPVFANMNLKKVLLNLVQR